ncbi:MAG: imidazoleglycerol-phosphate dehydratase [Candidatus Omnitrophica bacterium]|nr:imidazoleglycerol-phosphate dehydratase [Candidatus Omnitrophota bacterium]
MGERIAQFERKSKETEIKADLNIDGKGAAKIKTNIGLLDHMLELFVFHGCFDLSLEVQKADLEIDIHHTNEDIGIVLGKIFKKALGDKEGINRFGSGFAPMEDTLGHVVVDISGRGYLTLDTEQGNAQATKDQEGYSLSYLEHFMESFAHGIGATVHVNIRNRSEDLHTTLEAAFKAFGLALDQATQINPRRQGDVPSTKGIID